MKRGRGRGGGGRGVQRVRGGYTKELDERIQTHPRVENCHGHCTCGLSERDVAEGRHG